MFFALKKDEMFTDLEKYHQILRKENISKARHLSKEKNWTLPLLLECPKSKQFQTPDLEIDFFHKGNSILSK